MSVVASLPAPRPRRDEMTFPPLASSPFVPAAASTALLTFAAIDFILAEERSSSSSSLSPPPLPWPPWGKSGWSRRGGGAYHNDLVGTTTETLPRNAHPGGPIVNNGMEPYVDEWGGVQVNEEYFFDPADGVKPEPWEAEWIWLPEEDREFSLSAPSIGQFRAEFDLEGGTHGDDDLLHDFVAYVTSDSLYRVWINGILALRGPPDHGRDYPGSGSTTSSDESSSGRWFYDSRNVTSYFRSGRNVVAAEVRYGRGTVHWSVVTGGRPGFLFELREALKTTGRGRGYGVVGGSSDGGGGEGELLLKTDDSSWRAYAPPLDEDGEEQEWSYWQSLDYDDSSWQNARIIPAASKPDVWEHLTASEVPPRMEVEYPVKEIRGLPSDRTLREDGTFEVVFDRVISGYSQIRVRGGRGARIVLNATFATSARLGYDGGTEGNDAVVTVEHPYMTEIAPSYHVQVTNISSDSPVEILFAGAYFTSQPVTYRGSFECDDAHLNELWNVSRWAVQINLQNRYLDSPNHQEPVSDWGDYMIESLVNYYAFGPDKGSGGTRLMRQDIRKFAWVLSHDNYTAFMPSYSLYWLRTLLDYYQYTADVSLLHEMAPHVRAVVDRYSTWIGQNTGIVSEAPNYMFMDWVDVTGYECHHPPAVIGMGYMTALYYHGLDLASRVTRIMGDKNRVEEYAHRQTALAESFRRELWDSTEGMFRDGRYNCTSVKPYEWLPSDRNVTSYSPHVNLLAALFGLVPGNDVRAREVIERFLREDASESKFESKSVKPLNAQMWFHHWIFEALHSIEGGEMFDRYALPLLHRWEIIPQTQSFREMWNDGDYSHGWCSTPLVQLSSRVLGVTPGSPGYRLIRVEPRMCGLRWARGRVPTPGGDVVVSWAVKRTRQGGLGKGEDGILLDLNMTVPNRAEAEVVTPDGTTRKVGAGRHTFRSEMHGVEFVESASYKN